MTYDFIETYRKEFTITGRDGVFCAFLNGQSIFGSASSSAEACKLIIDADYPVKLHA